MTPGNEAIELIKVSAVGGGGLFASIGLAQFSALVSIGVGLATFSYVCAKLFFLIKNKGRPADE